MFTMLGTIAEFERDLIYERTKAQGKHLGRYGKDTREVKDCEKCPVDEQIKELRGFLEQKRKRS